jgi:hypothetical protein
MLGAATRSPKQGNKEPATWRVWPCCVSVRVEVVLYDGFFPSIAAKRLSPLQTAKTKRVVAGVICDAPLFISRAKGKGR